MNFIESPHWENQAKQELLQQLNTNESPDMLNFEKWQLLCISLLFSQHWSELDRKISPAAGKLDPEEKISNCFMSN